MRVGYVCLCVVACLALLLFPSFSSADVYTADGAGFPVCYGYYFQGNIYHVFFGTSLPCQDSDSGCFYTDNCIDSVRLFEMSDGSSWRSMNCLVGQQPVGGYQYKRNVSQEYDLFIVSGLSFRVCEAVSVSHGYSDFGGKNSGRGSNRASIKSKGSGGFEKRLP